MKTFLSVLCLLPLCLSSVRADSAVTNAPAANTPAPAATAPATPGMIETNAGSASDAIDPAKDAEIRKLLDRMGTVKLTRQILAQMISNFRNKDSSVPAEFWDRAQEKMDADDLVKKIIPVYAKFYTLDDLKAINAFYETPAGQKVISATPQIMHESMMIGQEWGRQIGIDLMSQINEEKAKKAAEDAKAAAAATTNSAPAVK